MEGRNRGYNQYAHSVSKNTLCDVPTKATDFQEKKMSFQELGLRAETVLVLEKEGITTPTTIQEKSIPLVLEGKDVIAISKTGSGKTYTFGLPLLEKVQPRQGLQVLVMVPTRELAVQVSRELQKFTHQIRISTIYGGVSLQPQADELRYAEMVVGTPGRLLDHLGRRNLDLSKITCVVLDEADKMVEMGFIEDVSEILDYTPEYRQVLLFGATISSEIDHLKKKYMHDPETTVAETQVGEDFLEQYYYNIDHYRKFSLLVHLLKKEKYLRVLVFCSARSTVELVSKNLHKQGFKTEMIHGKLSQNRRLQMMDDFNQGKIDVLVASPVAARGLDIKYITHVFNYDLSPDPQEYVHRVGRTARAGEKGKAITLLSQKDYEVFGQVLSRYHMNVLELQLEEFPNLPFDTGRRFGERDGSRSFGSRRFGGQRSGFGDRSDPRPGYPQRRGFGGRDRPSYGSRPAGGGRTYAHRDPRRATEGFRGSAVAAN